MRKPMKLLPCLAATIVVSAFAAPAASAATTIGNSCIGNNAEEPPKTLVQLSQTSSSTPLAAPAAGVVTKWGLNVIPPFMGGISEKLKVLRPAPGKNTFMAVGESTVQPIIGGANSFDTRIPIQAGDRVGAVAVGVTGTIFCAEPSAPTDVMGLVGGDQGLNSTAAYAEVPMAQVAVSAVIEPDADGDGFGDETQDKCPQSAAAQAACPVLILDAVSQPPSKSAVRILVATSADAAIIVSGSAKLPGKTKKARVSAQAKLAPINQLVTPGKIATYTLNFTKPLKDALAGLSKKKTLKLEVSAEGKSLSGAASADKLTVKLKGQAKP